MPTPATTIGNADFELGDTLWTKGTGWTIGTTQSYSGEYGGFIDAATTGSVNNVELLNDYVVPVVPGQSITATGRVKGSGADSNRGAIFIDWLNGAYARVSMSQGNSSSNGSPNTWELSTVTAVCPAGAVWARVGFTADLRPNGDVTVDSATWDYVYDRTATLTSPLDAATYGEGATVQFTVDINGTSPEVDSVVYKDGVTQIAEVFSGGTYAYSTTTLALGVHVITAEVNLANGDVIITNDATITISGTPTPPDTREFKASNAYTYLVGSNFYGLASAMPLTAKVTGVELEIDYLSTILVRAKDFDVEAEGSDPNVIFDITNSGVVEAVLMDKADDVYSTVGGSISNTISYARSDYDLVEEGTSEDKKWMVLENTTPATLVVGGETSLFGLNAIAASDFLTKAIGVRFKPTLNAKPSTADSGDACIRFFIDNLRLRVYFDAGSAEYYFASADKTLCIKGELVSAYLTDGDFETGDASGVLQLNPTLTLMDGTQTWIGDDWTIHAAYPPTDANQIGTVAARTAADGIGMSYNGLPSTQAVVDNRSRYVFITANFYAVRQLDSIYGAHGLPRAFAYNGDFFYKIATQPDPEKDEPRHVAYHHGHLALGYDDGRVDISVVGQPYNFDGSLGASEWSIGDKVTGLLPLSGTILGIFGSKSIWGLSGTTVDNFSTQVVTPNIGAVEYTVTDMGFPVYANAYGVYTLAQTQAYGDYLGTPMSQDISPWLRPRLVRKYTSNQEVVVAWPVRSKNQYRLAFSDGYIMSMTLNSGQQTAPTFSFQQYIVYSASDLPPQLYENTTPVTIIDEATVESLITISNRDGDNARTSASVYVAITHSYVGDLIIDLVSPTAVVYSLKLVDDEDGDGGPQGWTDLHKTYEVTLTPEALNGVWTLRVQDAYAGDVGIIDSWTLTI